jgi:hypothetical protein
VRSSPDAPVGHTYVIAYPSVGVVKIGQSVYYAERVEQVVRHSPVPTEVVCAFIGLHHERDYIRGSQISASMASVLTIARN